MPSSASAASSSGSSEPLETDGVGDGDGDGEDTLQRLDQWSPCGGINSLPRRTRRRSARVARAAADSGASRAVLSRRLTRSVQMASPETRPQRTRVAPQPPAASADDGTAFGSERAVMPGHSIIGDTRMRHRQLRGKRLGFTHLLLLLLRDSTSVSLEADSLPACRVQ